MIDNDRIFFSLEGVMTNSLLSIYLAFCCGFLLDFYELKKEKREHFVHSLFYVEEIFFSICYLSQCMNIYTFTYEKKITSYNFLLVFKIFESLMRGW